MIGRPAPALHTAGDGQGQYSMGSGRVQGVAGDFVGCSRFGQAPLFTFFQLVYPVLKKIPNLHFW